jgi:pyruvate kinase
MFVDDGLLGFKVVEKDDLGKNVTCVIKNSGEKQNFSIDAFNDTRAYPGFLEECKGVNFSSSPDLSDLPALDKDDLRDLEFAMENNIDYIAVSCVRSAEDVEEAR